MTTTTEPSQPARPTAGARYATLLVHVEPGRASRHRVEMAAGLARDLDARLIGLGAEMVESIPAPDAVGYAAGEWYALLQEQVSGDLKLAEQAFLQDAGGCETEWRWTQDFPSRAMARVARAADLLVASPRGEADNLRSVDPAELVMTAGRPVLLAPEGCGRLHARSIVVAWKETREARRAVADALPLLQRADEVLVQAVCRKPEREEALLAVDDVVASLKRHGVTARADVAEGGSADVLPILSRAAQLAGADLIVAGAYGHSRAREWMFGGVTYELLHRPPCFVLFSH